MTVGIEYGVVSDWLAANIADTLAPFTYRRVAGGRSNLTYEVQDAAGRRLILRRPPLGPVLPSAHDMAREYRILDALGSTRIPVPTVRGFCRDALVSDRDFYVMDFVEGTIVRGEEDADRLLPVTRRAAASDSMIDVLASLHALDPYLVGLGELGRPNGYVERQLRRWQRQWTASKTRDIAAVEEAHRLLQRARPGPCRAAIVHGDYRIDNLIFDERGAVAAVLDWELCTLGDPLADLGLLMVYWIEAGESAAHLPVESATSLPGFPDRATLVRRYAERSGADVSAIDFYVALGYWKLACIVEGITVRDRFAANGDGQPTAAQQRLTASVPVLAERAVELLT